MVAVKVPDAHGAQVRSCVALGVVVTFVPAAQVVQVAHEPALAADQVPASQLVQVLEPATAYVPAAQLEHVDAFAAE